MNNSNTRCPTYSVNYSVLIAETVYKIVTGAERLIHRLTK